MGRVDRKGVVEEEFGMTANAVNALAYSPNIAYVVPVDSNGVSLGIPTFTGAWVDGYFKSDGTKNLQSRFEPCWDSITDYQDDPLEERAAYYHTFSGNPKIESSVDNQSNYTRIVVGSAADVSIFDGQASENNLEKQNFANWFSYYRSRFNTMKAAAGRAFASSSLGGPNAGDGNIRIAYQGLWGRSIAMASVWVYLHSPAHG